MFSYQYKNFNVGVPTLWLSLEYGISSAFEFWFENNSENPPKINKNTRDCTDMDLIIFVFQKKCTSKLYIQMACNYCEL